LKRNAIFMWAYITFIGISVILRAILDFSLWNPIIFAITFSSMFFAIEDFFTLLYQTKKKSCDITDDFVTRARTKKEEALSFFLKLDESVEKYKDTECDLTKLQEKAITPKNRIKKVLEIIDDLEKLNFEDRKKEKKFKIASYIFAYIGFLLLFVSLIVATLITVSPLIQEIITVVSFAIILITQQSNNHFLEKIEEENKRNNELLHRIVAESDEWLLIKDKLEVLLERIENNLLNTEGKCNAD